MKSKLLAEGLGTMMLLVAVVGSGIMAENLSGGNIGLALLANAIATGCALYFLITIFGPVSGAHFNPAVSMIFFLRKELSVNALCAFICVQVAGGILGVWLAHAMFELPILQASTTIRSGGGQWVSEVFATFGLVFIILAGLKARADAVPTLVALYITGAYWFTSSTSFANPAVTIARGFSDTFAGISPADILPFILCQIVGALIALVLARMVYR